MTSPDIAPYLDLVLIDPDTQGIYERARLLADSQIEGWNPSDGAIEVVLLEAFSITVGELVYAVNRTPGAITEILLRLFGIQRDQGAPAEATIRFDVADTLGHVIPEGTIVRLAVSPDFAIDFRTDVGLAIPPGSMSGSVLAVALTSTEAANGIAAGTAVEVMDAITFVNGAALATPPAGGREVETGEAMLARGQALLQRLVNTLVTPLHFVAAAALSPGVLRAAAIDNFNVDLGTGAPGDHPGHITIAVGGPGGLALTASAKAALLADLDAQAMALLALHVTNVTVTAVNVNITVRKVAGQVNADVQAAVRAIITEYLDPDTWPFGRPVFRNEILARADRAIGVDTVVDVVAPAADVTLPGIAALATAGTITVTVLDAL